MNTYKQMWVTFIVVLAVVSFFGMVRGDFYAKDCSGLMEGDGVIKYDNGVYKGHSDSLCGVPRWGFGGDSAYSQFPTRTGPGENEPFWLNIHDPEHYKNGVFWVPAYVAKPLEGPILLLRYPAYQGFFDVDLPPEYWGDARRPENLVKVRFMSLPFDDDNGNPYNDQADAHFRFRVKKQKENELHNFRYLFDWTQPSPDMLGIWQNAWWEDAACWDLAVFRPVHRFIINGNPTAWERTELGIIFPYNDPEDRSNNRCMYTIPLDIVYEDMDYEIEVCSFIPYVLSDLEVFLDEIESDVDTINSSVDNWSVNLQTIGHGGLKYAENSWEQESNPIQVLEIDSHLTKHSVLITAGVHYEQTGNFVMEGLIEELLHNIIAGNAAPLDYILIPITNPDAYEWGTVHARPYGTRPNGMGGWVKDPVLENGQQWYRTDDGNYTQDDVEAVALRAYMAGLISSTSFQCDGGYGTVPLLFVDLHCDVCPHPSMWEEPQGNPGDLYYRAPGNYGQAFTWFEQDLLTLRDTFAQRLSEDNPFMRPWDEWWRFEFNNGMPSQTVPGFENLLARVAIEYDENALYQDVTDTGGPTPTPACTDYTPVYREGEIRVYQTPGDTFGRIEVPRTYRISCYFDEGTTYFEDMGVDLLEACTDFIHTARPLGVPTPTPAPTYTPKPTPTPGGPPTPISWTRKMI